jgi:IS5 family transposase
VLRESDPQTTIWELLLPEELKRLPAELVAVDAYLDDERFIAPFRDLFDRRLGRPSVPVDTLLRLLYLNHRYQLGYESLCREVSDSIGWRRFCRIGLDRPVPHPTTLVKLVRRAGPEVIAQLNAALLDKLAQDRLLRGRKLRVDTTVVEADIDYPTDADLLEQAVRKVGGLVRRIKARGAASQTWFRDRGRAAGRRMRQLAHSLRRRSGNAMAEVDRLTGRSPGWPGGPYGRSRQWRATPAGRLAAALMMGTLRGWSASLRPRSVTLVGCWPRPISALPATG